MKKNLLRLSLLLLFAATACSPAPRELAREDFVRVAGQHLLTPQGDTLFIKGTNLGNWLNPEGYMFRFGKANSPALIDRMLCEAVGPDRAAAFWHAFKENYITRADIDFIASTGANTVRLPFHYKLFTDEDYMGLTTAQDGFARVDSVIGWCRDAGLYLILDMHDAPGGQTGDNIDDSYGYPWLFESEASQHLFCDIWRKIARRYRNEPVILGYELINEPIAPYFENMEELNARLEPLHKMAVQAIREVDRNHIILLGGAQWNGNFRPFTDASYDDNIMYTCHRYGGEPTREAIREIIEFRDRVGLPMYMGEIGHNTDEWMHAFCEVMREANIGYTFWPYKKIDGSSFVAVEAPEGWQTVRDFAEAPRGTYAEVRAARPDQEEFCRALDAFIERCRFENCTVQQSYIDALMLDK